MPKQRWDVINALTEKRGYRRYLEIGLGLVEEDRSIQHVRVESGESVDPFAQGATHLETSDVFFKKARRGGLSWDIIFIDGLHTRDQVLRDVDNALHCLTAGGAIVCHDCNPQKVEHTTQGQPHFNGTVWEAWAHLRMTQPALSMHCLDLDEGCGIIERGTQTLFPPTSAALSYPFLEENRSSLLALTSWEEWIGTL